MLKENTQKRETKWKIFEKTNASILTGQTSGQIKLKNCAKSGLRNAKEGETRHARRAKPEESRLLNEKNYI